MKVLVLSSHTKSLYWFRKDMMLSMIAHNCEVVAVGNEKNEEWTEKFKNNGIIYKQINISRNGLNIFSDLRLILDLVKLFNEVKPDKIFSYQAKTVIYGSIAAKIARIPEYYALVAGLGSVLRGKGVKNAIIGAIMKLQYFIAFMNSKVIFFQNKDDLSFFTSRRLIREKRTVLINGSGVNLDIFKPQIQLNPKSFLFIGRLIADKGLVEYLEAAREIKKMDWESKFYVVGPLDTNPSSISMDELSKYIDDGSIIYYGEQDNVLPFLEKVDTFILPSYYEGTPKSVLEAMACGKAIITTDAPGCRETVTNYQNGILVEPRSIDSLVKAILFILNNPDKKEEMGTQSQKIAREKFDVIKVNNIIMTKMGIK